MTVSYQLEEADLAAAARYTATHHPAIQNRLFWVQLILALVPGAAVLLAAYLRLGLVRPLDLFLAALSTGVAYFLASYFLLRSYVRRALQLRAGEGGAARSFSLTLGEQGIATTSERGSSLLPWGAVQYIEQDRRHIYLALAPAGLLVVPKHAFADDDATQEFVREVKSRKAPSAAGSQ